MSTLFVHDFLRLFEFSSTSSVDFKNEGLVAEYINSYFNNLGEDAILVMLLHSWSFLYRSMIPPLADAGLRTIAPDLVGFGRSDKPDQSADYSYQRLVDWTADVVFNALDLRDITLFGQDWGGLVGLRPSVRRPDRESMRRSRACSMRSTLVGLRSSRPTSRASSRRAGSMSLCPDVARSAAVCIR